MTYRLLKAIFRHAPAYIYGLEGFTFMKRVTTVCGDIAPEELGFTDMHEHIMFNGADMGGNLQTGHAHGPAGQIRG